jgi:hypothetical protein
VILRPEKGVRGERTRDIPQRWGDARPVGAGEPAGAVGAFSRPRADGNSRLVVDRGHVPVRLVDGEATPAAIIKRIRWSRDWHAIATEDTIGRELAIWEAGVLDRLPIAMGHAVRGAARFEDGAALLMDDLDHFLPDDSDVTPERAMGVLRSMAAMHAAFGKTHRSMNSGRPSVGWSG